MSRLKSGCNPRAENRSGEVPVEIRITDPNGNDSEYSQNVCAVGGVVKYSYRTVVNDEPGEWMISVRSLVGNAEASATLRLRAR